MSSYYNDTISYGNIPNSIISLYGDFIKVGKVITSIPDNFGNYNSSEEVKGYYYNFYSSLNIFNNLNLNHFFPKNKNIRIRYVDKDGEYYCCKITDINLNYKDWSDRNLDFKIQIYIKKEDIEEDRDRRLNREEVDLIRELDKKEIKLSRFEIMDI